MYKYVALLIVLGNTKHVYLKVFALCISVEIKHVAEMLTDIPAGLSGSL